MGHQVKVEILEGGHGLVFHSTTHGRHGMPVFLSGKRVIHQQPGKGSDHGSGHPDLLLPVIEQLVRIVNKVLYQDRITFTGQGRIEGEIPVIGHRQREQVVGHGIGCLPCENMLFPILLHAGEHTIGAGQEFPVTPDPESNRIDLVFQHLFYREPVFCIVWLREGVGHIKSIVSIGVRCDPCKKAVQKSGYLYPGRPG